MKSTSRENSGSYLWLTRFYPYPCHAGDKIYSARLIEALASTGCSLTVHCTSDGSGTAPSSSYSGASNIEWVRLPPASRYRSWFSPFSGLPRQAFALAGPMQRTSLQVLLRSRTWDAIVFDYVTMGWALPLIEERWPDRCGRPSLIYVSHNHEPSLRHAVATMIGGSLPKRLALSIDAERIAAMDRRLVAAASLVTVITEADQTRYRLDAPTQRFEVLSPGYSGLPPVERQITSATPRRIVVTGSFNWVAKQHNLTEFLAASADALADRGIGIDIVGQGPPGFFEGLRHRFSSVMIHGAVEGVEPYLQGARISVIPERIGGGFKLKALDAVFQRTPIFALTGSIAGLPLEQGRSVRLLPNFAALVAAIVDGIDNLDELNAQQNAAFAACTGRFDWAERGAFLRALIDDISRPMRMAPE